MLRSNIFSSFTRNLKLTNSLLRYNSGVAVKVSAANVKALRERTGLSMTLCKQALSNGDNDVDKALKWLNDNAEARAEMLKNKVGDRSVNQGRIHIVLEKTHAAILEVNCETDFVARNDQFLALCEKIGKASLTLPSKEINTIQNVNIDELNECSTDGEKVSSLLASALASMGENIKLNRAAIITTENAACGGYIHGVGSYGSLVCTKGDDVNHHTTLMQLSAKVAQHVVAMQPEGKSKEELIHNLLQQPFVLDAKLSVGELLNKTAEETGAQIMIADVVRWQRS